MMNTDAYNILLYNFQSYKMDIPVDIFCYFSFMGQDLPIRSTITN